MYNFVKRLMVAAMGAVLCVSLASCSSKDVAYPVTIDGTEVMAGETTLSVLYDAGYTIMSMDTIGSTEVEASYQLDADSYYTGLYIAKGDTRIASVALVTDKKAVPASDAVIGSIEVNSEYKHPLDTATFAGVKISELTPEKFQEVVAGSKMRDDGNSAYYSGSKYLVRADYKDGAIISLQMKRNYDVDYGK